MGRAARPGQSPLLSLTVSMALCVISPMYLCFTWSDCAATCGCTVYSNNARNVGAGRRGACSFVLVSLTVVVFSEASLEALELVAGGRLSSLHVGVALKATNCKTKRKRETIFYLRLTLFRSEAKASAASH